MRQLHEEQIETVVAALKGKTIDHVYFTVRGGSQAVLTAGQYLSDKELTMPCHVYTANEFSYAIPKGLSENSSVITRSHSGTTPKAVEATKEAREFGAMTICLSSEEGSPLWGAAEYPVHYDWGRDVDISGLNKGIPYDLLFNILLVLDGFRKWETCLNEFGKLNDLAIAEESKFEITVKEWGKDQKRDKIIYTIGSGINYGEIYSTAACWFMEMQWINSNAVHSGESFCGPFGIIDYDILFILAKNTGDIRFLSQRIEDFTKKSSNRLTASDQADFDLESTGSVAKEYTTTILSGVATRQMMEATAFERDHSLDARRYMWQIKY